MTPAFWRVRRGSFWKAPGRVAPCAWLGLPGWDCNPAAREPCPLPRTSNTGGYWKWGTGSAIDLEKKRSFPEVCSSPRTKIPNLKAQRMVNVERKLMIGASGYAYPDWT